MRSVGLTRAIRPMSLVARPIQGSRFSSTDHHGYDAVYPKEGFVSPVWGGFIAFSALVVAFYKFAPAPAEDNMITRFISRFSTPAERWEHANFKHVLASQEASEQRQTVWHAQQPAVHRYRYPAMMDQGMPHRQPVGPTVDFSGVVVKG